MNPEELTNDNGDFEFEEIPLDDSIFESIEETDAPEMDFASGFEQVDEDNDLDEYQKKIKIRNQKRADDAIKKRAFIKECISDVIFFLVVFAIMFFLNKVVWINSQIPSASMEPTVMTGDRIFGNRLAYKGGKMANRFDIIIFKYPDDPSQLFIKRVIGLPGETVTIVDGNIYINDDPTPLEENFEHIPTIGSFGPYYVPSNGYFVMGDNRVNSLDSRYWQNTFVTEDLLLGRAAFRYFPFSSFGKIE